MTDITFAEYRALQAVNVSTLLKLDESPKHYLHQIEHGSGDTPALQLGRAVHSAVLEPAKFDAEYIAYPGKVRRGKEYDQFLADNEGCTVLTKAELAQTITMRDAVRAHPNAKPYLNVPGVAELSLTWTDEQTGYKCKGRLDWVTDTALVDLKTARNVDSRMFGFAAADHQYITRMAWYADALERVDEKPRKVVLLAVEKTAPYDVVPYVIPTEYLELGTRHYRKLLDKLAECRATDEWPGIATGDEFLWVPENRLPMLDDDVQITVGGQSVAL